MARGVERDRYRRDAADVVLELVRPDIGEPVSQPAALAEDESLPLLERLKFLAIFVSNLDEFFMIRVAGVHDQVDARIDARGPDGLTPIQALQGIARRVAELDRRHSRQFREVIKPELACQPLGIEIRAEPVLSGEPFDVRDLTAGLGDVLLVGHDPSFSLLVHDMTGAQTRLKKGGLAGVNKGELVVLLRPAELAAIAETDAALATA